MRCNFTVSVGEIVEKGEESSCHLSRFFLPEGRLKPESLKKSYWENEDYKWLCEHLR